jgi:hypothetical protein
MARSANPGFNKLPSIEPLKTKETVNPHSRQYHTVQNIFIEKFGISVVNL